MASRGGPRAGGSAQNNHSLKEKMGINSNHSLMVAAIENGTVLDHIPSAKLFEVVNLLHLSEIRGSSIMVGFNLASRKFGHKSIIKVSDKYFTDAEINQLAVVAPSITLCIIKDYQVVEKKRVTLPPEMRGILRCNNPRCITNHEPMPTWFHTCPEEPALVRCHYCEKEQTLTEVKLVELK